MQYHYISDKELYHYGRSKKDGAKIGSGRYPLGSGNSKYKNKIALKIEEDYKNQSDNSTSKTISKKRSAESTLLKENSKIMRNSKIADSFSLATFLLGGFGGFIATALTFNPAFFTAGFGLSIASMGAIAVSNHITANKQRDLIELANTHKISDNEMLSKKAMKNSVDLDQESLRSMRHLKKMNDIINQETTNLSIESAFQASQASIFAAQQSAQISMQQNMQHLNNMTMHPFGF